MPAKKPAQWDQVVDVIVMGTGGAAMSAALTAAVKGSDVLVIEKAKQVGGTTAFSGGIPWIPMNRYMMDAGIEDNRELALQYATRLTGGKEPDPELVEVFIDNGYKMIDFMHEHSELRFHVPKSYPSYYGHLPGAVSGRSLDPEPYELAKLGEWGDKLRQNPTFPPLTLEEGGAVGGIDFMKIAERMENNIVTMGRALVAPMLKAFIDRGGNVMLETAGKELVLDDAGNVIGLIAEKADGTKLSIGARQGVVIASGGFEWNKHLVKTFLKGEVTHPMSPPGNDGDGLIMAMEAGAALGNMSEAWWYPAMVDPTFEYDDHVMNQLGGGRFGPNSIIVNKHGKRFVHEGTTYNDLPKAFYQYDPVELEFPNEPPVWMIFDQQLKDKAMIITMMPGEDAPEWVASADSIRELAEKIGVNADNLEEQVNRWNNNSDKGIDPDFHRGETFFEGINQGGGRPDLNIGPINQAPYYALPIYFGALGTSGGPRIDENGQVISLRNQPIQGLYAAGNAAMGIMGTTYASAGGTLGPAMTFGYLAGLKISSEAPRNI